MLTQAGAQRPSQTGSASENRAVRGALHTMHTQTGEHQRHTHRYKYRHRQTAVHTYTQTYRHASREVNPKQRGGQWSMLNDVECAALCASSERQGARGKVSSCHVRSCHRGRRCSRLLVYSLVYNTFHGFMPVPCPVSVSDHGG